MRATFSHKGRRLREVRGRRAPSQRHLAIPSGNRLVMAMTVDLPALQRTDAGTPRAPSARWRRYARPLLGLLLPVGLAALWELLVWLGTTGPHGIPHWLWYWMTAIGLANVRVLPAWASVF